MMPKWLLYGLAAAGDFAVAAVLYGRGRPLLAALLAVAGVTFVIAAVGSARGAGGTRR